MNPQDDKSNEEIGNYMVFGKEPRWLVHHPTDFSVVESPSSVREKIADAAGVSQLVTGMSRVRTDSPEHREDLMKKMRTDAKYAAHHIYQFQDTNEEMVIADRIYLTLRDDQPDKLKAILDNFTELEEEERIGKTYVLRVSDCTLRNPLKLANQIAGLNGVESCIPKILPRLSRNSAPIASPADLGALSQSHKLFERQWHLTPRDTAPGASINVDQAWRLLAEKKSPAHKFGDPEIVIAVIDDGFDLDRPGTPPILGHPVFSPKIISKEGKNFAGGDPGAFSRENDIHGTPVASIATAFQNGDGMLGVAPNCALLPLRISLGSHVDLHIVLKALEVASEFADVVNCSFSLAPASEDFLLKNAWFVTRVREMTRTGGRRHKGLVIVFSAGNDDAPTFLSAAENVGIRFPQETTPPELGEIKAGFPVHSGFAQIPGVVVVSAMSSLKRKAGYSNWGPHITVAAPSDNDHDMLRLATDDRKDFIADYPGLRLIAAVNQIGHGEAFKPLPTPGILGFDDDIYTDQFGRTSGAAAIVTGVAALVLSANPDLRASKVIDILKATADDGESLLTDLDLKDDPNLKGVSADVATRRSLFFGAGKVDAGAAVQLAFQLGQRP